MKIIKEVYAGLMMVQLGLIVEMLNYVFLHPPVRWLISPLSNDPYAVFLVSMVVLVPVVYISVRKVAQERFLTFLYFFALMLGFGLGAATDVTCGIGAKDLACDTGVTSLTNFYLYAFFVILPASVLYLLIKIVHPHVKRRTVSGR